MKKKGYRSQLAIKLLPDFLHVQTRPKNLLEQKETIQKQGNYEW